MSATPTPTPSMMAVLGALGDVKKAAAKKKSHLGPIILGVSIAVIVFGALITLFYHHVQLRKRQEKATRAALERAQQYGVPTTTTLPDPPETPQEGYAAQNMEEHASQNLEEQVTQYTSSGQGPFPHLKIEPQHYMWYQRYLATSGRPSASAEP
ncbi:hypothetical protein TWF696_008429 [Orbilia brochopaga]|uniref:Uncharacterized protein n=1 Tax=Orbilia brochopaga TaxID=3140254 RepID=A0AAV9UJS1_9PEZI